MKITLLRDGPERTFAALLNQGDEPMSALLQFARDHKIADGSCHGSRRLPTRDVGSLRAVGEGVQTNCN